MPRMDGTGPTGAGPGSGWGRGPCGAGSRRGRWFGRGLGFFSGRRRTETDEKAALEDEEKMLKEEIKAVQKEKEALNK